MGLPRNLTSSQVIHAIFVLLLTASISLRLNPACARHLHSSDDFDYPAINCRAHSASLTDFGAVGDGSTLNTKAIQAAIDHLSQFESDGGSMLFVPPGKWLTGSFNVTSHFTLYLHKDAVLLASQDENDYAVIKALPSYGRGRDTVGGRYISLIFGTNLTDVVITGNNGTIDGQGHPWWDKFHKGELQYTRPYLIEIMFSENVQISNLTLLNSPSWHVHPVYCSNVIVQGLTILAPVSVPNTDGINPVTAVLIHSHKITHSRTSVCVCSNDPTHSSAHHRAVDCRGSPPDSCTNTRIEDSYIVSGDDCIAVKSGWDEYGIAFAMPTKQLVIRRLTCVSPFSAVIALGSEMSGGIEDVRAEDIVAVNSESGIRIKTAEGRGSYVKNIFARRMTMKTMKWAFWMTGNYGSHPDDKYDPNALPVIENINYRDMVAENVTMAARLEGIAGDPFTGICLSNVTVGMAKKAKKVFWNCTDIEGISSGVVPQPCPELKDKGSEYIYEVCQFPTDTLPIDDIEIRGCSYRRRYSLGDRAVEHS
ncbi:hypothetical protein OROHE_024637 [Orobanche hederae]